MKRTVSAILLVILLTSMLYSASKIMPAGAALNIYIRADGSIDPSDAPISTVNNVTYTLTGNVTDTYGIWVERDNIVLDGAGYTVQGTPLQGCGVVLWAISNVTIKNMKIDAFAGGIGLYNSLNVNVSGNTFTNNGLIVANSYQNFVQNNTVNGKPLVYLEGVSNYSIEDAGQVILVRCENIKVEGLNLSRTDFGVELLGTSNCTISGSTITANQHSGIGLDNSSNINISGNNITADKGWYGIGLYSSSNITISGNNITANKDNGINLFSSSNITIFGNTITAHQHYGIYLDSSSNNSISGNNIANNGYGIMLISSSNYNSVSGNNVTANDYIGIMLVSSLNNRIFENHIVANKWFGIGLDNSSSNKIFHNNFVNNNIQVYLSVETNIWDDDYPSGGNYWSDYIDVDSYSGIDQNILGSDSIWDHPYIIDENDTDHYPLVAPWIRAPTYVQGIDVSHYQGDINWTEVYGAGYRFAFVKATEGEGWTGDSEARDAKFEYNMNASRAADMLVGAYHFARPDLNPNGAIDEATWFVNVSREYVREGYLRPVLDLEKGSSLGKESLSAWVHTWLEIVETETGIEPIIYTGGDYVNPAVDILNASLTEYDLWIAHWTYNLSTPPNTGIWNKWEFWQWSNESQFAPLGYVPGVQGNALDLDVFNGDLQTLRRDFIIHTPVPCWVKVGTHAEYLITNPKNASETVVWKWKIVTVAADQIEVLHTFSGLWGIPSPDYPSVFKSTIDLATRGVTNVTAMDKALPPGYGDPLVTLFALWIPLDMQINDNALVIGPYGASYPPAPVLRFENISSPLETEICATMGWEVEKGYSETDLWSYSINTNVLVKSYMNWSRQDAEEVVMLKQWVPVNQFNFTYAGETYEIIASSNSTIKGFYFNPEEGPFIALNVTGLEGTKGFCNVTVPDDLLWGDFSVKIDGSPLTKDIDYTQDYNGTHYTFLINYTHSTHAIEIRGTEVIPEFPSFFIMPILTAMIVTLLAVIAYRKKRISTR